MFAFYRVDFYPHFYYSLPLVFFGFNLPFFFWLIRSAAHIPMLDLPSFHFPFRPALAATHKFNVFSHLHCDFFCDLWVVSSVCLVTSYLRVIVTGV